MHGNSSGPQLQLVASPDPFPHPVATTMQPSAGRYLFLVTTQQWCIQAGAQDARAPPLAEMVVLLE